MKKRFLFILAITLVSVFIMLPVYADNIDFTGFYEEVSVIENEEGLYGYEDKTGEIVIPCIYDRAYPFKYGIAAVTYNTKMGFINKSGEFVIQPKYDDIQFTITASTYMKNFLYVDYFENGPLIFEIYDNENQKLVTGLIDAEGKELFVSENCVIRDFHNGTAIISKDDKYGLLGIDGTLIILPQYNEMMYISYEYPLISVEKDGKWGFIDTSGKEIIPCIYDDFGSFYKGLIDVQQNGKWGFIDINGNVIVPFIYDEVKNGSYDEFGVAAVCINNKWGFIDSKGNLVLDIEYDYVSRYIENGLIYVGKDGKYGYVNIDGKFVIPMIYQGSCDKTSGAFAMMKDGKIGIVDNKGNELTQFEFDKSERMHSVLFNLQKNGKWGCVDKNGKTVIPFEYDKISEITYNCVIAVKDGKYGALSLNNEILIPFEYTISLTPYDSTGMACAVSLKSDVNLEEATWDNMMDYLDITYYIHPDYIPSKWAEDEVKKARENWLVPYYMISNYTQDISRAEFCLLIAYLIQAVTHQGYESIKITEHFTDTDALHISAMASIGIVNGTGDGLFSPYSGITREEAAVMLKRAAEYLGVGGKTSESDYSDSDTISSWAKDSVSFVSANGIMGGTDNNKFSPKGMFTREQAIITMLRLFNIAQR